MNQRISYLILFFLCILLAFAQDFTGENLVLGSEPSRVTSEMQELVDERYGYRFQYPNTFSLISNRNSGASHIVKFLKRTDGETKIYWVTENFDTSYNTLQDWLADREIDPEHTLVRSRPIELDKMRGIERVYLNNETYSIAQYYQRNNKVYLLNIGPLSSPYIPMALMPIVDGFEWLSGEFLDPVPTRGKPVLRNPSVAAGQPPLQFPFCGTWKIYSGYYPDHPDDPYNYYALDWKNNEESTFRQPIYAAHGGTVATSWDAVYGGGNVLKLTYNNDTSYVTWYAHLDEFTVSSGSVQAGGQIGLSGCTGFSCTGDHLHFALLHNNTSVKPEPMSGVTGFARNQTHTRDCSGSCGCLPASCLTAGQTVYSEAFAGSSGSLLRPEGPPAPLLTPSAPDILDIEQEQRFAAATPAASGSVIRVTKDIHSRDADAGSDDLAESAADPDVPVEPIVIDRMPPQLIDFSVGHGGEVVRTLNVMLSLTAADEGSGVAMMRFGADGRNWGEWQPFQPITPWLLDDVPQTQTIYAQLQDAAGNVSEPIQTTVRTDLAVSLPSSANYAITRSVMGMGGGKMISSGHTVHGTSGQAHQATHLLGTTRQVYSGFWSPESPESTTTQLALPAGWKLVSSFVEPQNPQLEVMLADILDEMVLLKNGDGDVFWPAYGINQIGSWDVRDGYMIYMTNASALAVRGRKVVPEDVPIALPQGWSQIAFLRDNPMPVATALASLQEQIVLVKNGHGAVYWPAFDIDQIESLQPDEGYQVYLSDPATLTYPANNASSSVSSGVFLTARD